MKNYSKYICLFLLLVGMSFNAWGEATTITYTFINKYWHATSGGSAANWTSVTDGSDFESGVSGRGVANNGVNGSCTSPRAFYNVSSISIVAASNMSDADGKVAIKIGNTQIANKTIANGSGTYTYSSSDYASIASLSGDITINVTKPSSKTLWIKSISITYTPVAFTVTYNAQGGTCEISSETEAEPGDGVLLPEASPSHACEVEGWGFYGWATTAKTSDYSNAPTIVGKAEDIYYPTSDVTLHAVYAMGEYTKITSTGDITSGGKYIIVGYDDNNSKVYAMTNESYTDNSLEHLKGAQIGTYPTNTYSAAKMQGEWRCEITYSTSNQFYIRNLILNKYVDTQAGTNYILTNTKYGSEYYTISYANNSNGYCSILNNQSGYGGRYLVVYVGGGFSKHTNAWEKMMIYKETTTPSYNSNPSCCDKIVELSIGTETNAEFEEFSTFDLPTCSSTAADRQVTISVSPSTGYEFTSSARLGYSGDGTATYVSGPTDNGDGAYNFVYQFAQNDNGSGTFSVTSATLINYTISFDANGGTGTMDDVENKTYGSTHNLPTCTFTRPTDKIFDHWAAGSTSGTSYAAGAEYTMGAGNITFYAIWRTATYTEAKFSCAELTLTPVLVTASTPIFITSAANKTVRSQDYIEITGNGLTPSTALTFPGLPSKFAIKNADGTAVTTDVNGEISTNAYIFYTPDAGDTSDGLDKLTGITVSVEGAKPKTVNLTQDIIGRHLPADFVIAAKNTTTNKWYALPANMSGTGNPVPVEIAVDDINNPTIAYTAASNVYNLYLSADKEKVQLGMKNNVDGSSKSYALWANNAASSTDIGKNTGLAENTLGNNYKWTLTQTNTSITNPQDAKYTISNLNNVNPLKSWFAASGGPKWGLYASGVAELRLIPASSVVPTEAYFVEWGQHGGVIEVDAEGVDATSVVAHLGEATSSAITLVQTKASDAKNKSSKYNYTVNFGDGIDFSAAASNGAMLTLEWKNGATTKAVSNIVVPKIVASNITINKANYPLKSDWNTEVHVLPGKTVTVDPSAYDGSNVTIKELNIYPGATVVASTGTLIATNLVLRNGWSRAGEKTYDVARLYVTPSTATLKATNVYADWYIDYDQYYPVAVPWKVATAGITYLNTSNSASGGVKLRYYDGEGRANGTNGSAADGANWLEYSRVVEGKTYNYPETLNPGKGYAMTARRPTGKAFSIVRLPLTLPSGTWGEGSWTTNGEAGTIGAAPSDVHKDTVYVHAWGVDDESKPRYAVGWNFIANPYMSIYQGPITHSEGNSYNVEFVTIPDTEFKEYDQYPVGVEAGKGEKLLPASGFFIQTAKDGTLTFGTGNRQAAAPSFRNEVQNLTNKQKAYIVLNDEENEDMMGLLVSDLYTADYDINGDLEKLMGEANSLKTYMRYNEMNMAYVAINEELAREWIPVTVRIPENGEYTYSLHEASIADELEGVYLIDYQNGNVITNLLDNSYTFYSPSGIISGRFAINAIVGKHDTPTDIDIINAGGDIHSDKPVKFIYRDKVYILHRGVIYDSTGKKVREIKK